MPAERRTSRWSPPSDLQDIVPWLSPDGLIGGCWTPEDGRVNPTDGVYGLAAAARKLGVKFRQHTYISKIEKAKGGWTLQTAEPIKARRVIVAGGLGSPDLYGRSASTCRSRR